MQLQLCKMPAFTILYLYLKFLLFIYLYLQSWLNTYVTTFLFRNRFNVVSVTYETSLEVCGQLHLNKLNQHLKQPYFYGLIIFCYSIISLFSLLILLRCQVHTELAKCEEDMEQIQVAMEHLKKVTLGWWKRLKEWDRRGEIKWDGGVRKRKRKREREREREKRRGGGSGGEWDT